VVMSYNRDLVGWPYLKNPMSNSSLGLAMLSIHQLGKTPF
jgi:hypothetical protein